MTKTQTWETVQALMVEHKANKKLAQALEDLLMPKNGGSINPPKLDAEGVMVEAYCRFHQRYEPVADMVVSGGKSKGYCKASISKWNKTNAKIKKLEGEAVEAMGKGDFDNAQAIAKNVTELKEGLNKPENYDYDADHKAFNA